jgi:hypothetical protein
MGDEDLVDLQQGDQIVIYNSKQQYSFTVVKGGEEDEEEEQETEEEGNVESPVVPASPFAGINSIGLTSNTSSSSSSRPLSFWNPEWNPTTEQNENKVHDKGKHTTAVPVAEGINKRKRTTRNTSTTTTHTRDINPSLAQQCWKAMNHSTPYIGSMYLHTLLKAANQLPSTETTCEDIMKLLTEGPQQHPKKSAIHDGILPSPPPPPPPPPRRPGEDSPASLLYDPPSDGEDVPSTSTSNKSSASLLFVWDGPQLHYALKYYQHLLEKFPSVMIPRFNDAATNIFGNDKHWWKTLIDEIIASTTTTTTCMKKNTRSNCRSAVSKKKKRVVATKKRKVGNNKNNKNDENDENEQPTDDEGIDEEEEEQNRQQWSASVVHQEEKEIDKLRMHSCTVQALIDLLQASISLERQQHNKNNNEDGAKIEDVDNDDSDDSDVTEDEDSDDDDDERKNNVRSKQSIPNIKLLNDIRDYGPKSVLLVVGLALAHVWTTQWMFLIPEMADTRGHSSASLHESRVDVVETLVDQLTTLFGILFKIVTTKDPSSALHGEETEQVGGRRRLRRSGRSNVVSKSDAKQVLWDAMVMKMDQEETIIDDPKLQEESIRQNLLIRWVGSLEKSLGEDIAKELAKQADIVNEIEMGFAW